MACLSEGIVIEPFEIFELVSKNKIISDLLNVEIEKRGILGLMRTLLQYEDVRSEKKRTKIIEIINNFHHAKRNGTKDL